jgi:hypothetical protein
MNIYECIKPACAFRAPRNGALATTTDDIAACGAATARSVSPFPTCKKFQKIGRILRNMKTDTALRSARILFIPRPLLYINRRLRERNAIEKKVPGDREKLGESPESQHRRHIVDTR